MSESTEPAHEGVDEFIVDPIRVSLLATIDDEQTAYRDPDKLDRHSLFEAKTIDIWETSSRNGGGAQVLDRSYPVSRRLPPDLFEAYHPSLPRSSSTSTRLALRLLITRPAIGSNETARHDNDGPPGDRQINYLPFLAADVQDLIRQWDLNREYTWMRLNAREVGNFQRKTVWNFDVEPPRAVRMGIVINFPFVLRPARQTRYFADPKNKGNHPSRRALKSLNNTYNPHRDDPFLWSLAMSHSLRDGKTRGLLDGLTNWAVGDVSRRILKATQQWYLHPLHVPVILLGIFFDHAAWEINRLCVEVERFEYLSRDAGIGSLEQFDTITTELQYIRRDLDFLMSLTKFLLETMDFLEKKIFEREASARGGRSDDGISESYKVYVYQTNPHMEEKLNNTLHLIENNLSTSQYLQARTQDALDFIKGKISLADNASNREDADSNKVMSFLQMTFLPATFVAAIVSMNFFDLTTSPPKVSGYIWIFWLVALGLTAAVLGIYFAWKWRTKMKIEQEEREGRRRERGVVADSAGSGSAGEGGGSGGRRKKHRSKRRSARTEDLGDSDNGGGGGGGGGGKKRKEKPELTE